MRYRRRTPATADACWSPSNQGRGGSFRARGRAPIDLALDSELPHLSPDRRRRMIELLDELGELINAPEANAETGE